MRVRATKDDKPVAADGLFDFKNRPPYPRRTMEYPHPRRVVTGRNPVLSELLENMKLAVGNGHIEQLSHMLCAGIWWLSEPEIHEVYGWILERLEAR